MGKHEWEGGFFGRRPTNGPSNGVLGGDFSGLLPGILGRAGKPSGPDRNTGNNSAKGGGAAAHGRDATAEKPTHMSGGWFGGKDAADVTKVPNSSKGLLWGSDEYTVHTRNGDVTVRAGSKSEAYRAGIAELKGNKK